CARDYHPLAGLGPTVYCLPAYYPDLADKQFGRGLAGGYPHHIPAGATPRSRTARAHGHMVEPWAIGRARTPRSGHRGDSGCRGSASTAEARRADGYREANWTARLRRQGRDPRRRDLSELLATIFYPNTPLHDG